MHKWQNFTVKEFTSIWVCVIVCSNRSIFEATFLQTRSKKINHSATEWLNERKKSAWVHWCFFSKRRAEKGKSKEGVGCGRDCRGQRKKARHAVPKLIEKAPGGRWQMDTMKGARSSSLCSGRPKKKSLLDFRAAKKLGLGAGLRWQCQIRVHFFWKIQKP